MRAVRLANPKSITISDLSPWWNVSLPAPMLANLHARLGEFRAAGVSVLFNFGYEDGKTDFLDDVEPFTFDQIYAHVAQLRPVLQANADVVYGLQAGFIGNAGEWAHDIRGLLNNATGLASFVSQLLYSGILPPDRQVLIRKGDEKLHLLQGTPFAHCIESDGHKICSGLEAERRDASAGEPQLDPRWQYGVVDSGSANSQLAFARLGHYDASFMSTKGDGGTFDPSDMRDRWFAFFAREAPFVAVDGEMYYGTPWPAKQRLLVEGHEAALRMVQHSYNTFSHHNSYYPLDDENTPTPRNKSLNIWMQTRLNVSWLRQHQLPITDAFAAASEQTDGTVYTYIREHLGYRLELDSAIIRAPGAAGAPFAIELALYNRGFSAPVNARTWCIALLDPKTHAVAWRSESLRAVFTSGAERPADWRLLHPVHPGDPLRTPVLHSISITAVNPPPTGSFAVGFQLADPLAKGHADEATTVRFTNSKWVSGWNVIGEVALPTRSGGASRSKSDDEPLQFKASGVPGGGSFFSPSLHPTLGPGQEFYVSSDMSGLYRSADAGSNHFEMVPHQDVLGGRSCDVQFGQGSQRFALDKGFIKKGGKTVTLSRFAALPSR